MILYKQWGGARVGVFRGTWPFGRLIVEPGKITVSVMLRRKSFSPQEVAAIHLPYGSTYGLEIHYRGPHWDESVEFFANLQLEKLLPALATAGFDEIHGAD